MVYFSQPTCTSTTSNRGDEHEILEEHAHWNVRRLSADGWLCRTRRDRHAHAAPIDPNHRGAGVLWRYSLNNVILPDDITRIEAEAFANSSVQSINLPDSIIYVDDTAFDQSALKSVSATEGSYAYVWAVEKGYIQIPGNSASDFEYEIADGQCTVHRHIRSSGSYAESWAQRKRLQLCGDLKWLCGLARHFNFPF